MKLGFSKYRNKKVVVDGIKFDSMKEAARWKELKLLEKSKKIIDLKRQVRFKLDINSIHICTYIADFSYRHWQDNFGFSSFIIVEDVKSEYTKKFPSIASRKNS